MQDGISVARRANVVEVARRRKEGLPSSPYRGVSPTSLGGRWTCVVCTRGPRHTYLGTFDDEKECALHYDSVVVEVLNRPEDRNFDEHGVPTGTDARATSTANLVGSKKRKSKFHGVGKNGKKWRALLRVPLCLLNNRSCKFRTDESVCFCPAPQQKYPSVANAIDAAKEYNQWLRHYGMHLKPYNKPLNPGI